MRSVSFVEHIEFDFSGNLFNEALLLEDIDNDGSNELVLGNVNGELFIFKGTGNKPWKVSRQDGMITCIGAGDLWNKNKKLLVCITADGWCHLYDVENEPKDIAVLKPTYSQLLPSNAKTLLIADIDGDGQCELVTGHTDREVHIHRWIQSEHVESPGIKEPSAPAAQETAKALSSSVESKSMPTAKSGKEKKTTTVEPQKKNSQESSKQSSKDGKAKEDNKDDVITEETFPATKHVTGHFVGIKTWSLSSEITSLVLYKSYGTQYLLVSQPGGAFINLLASDIPSSKEDQESSPCKSPTLPGFSSALEFPLPFLRGKHNPIIPTTLVSLSPNRTHNRLDQSSRSSQSNRSSQSSEDANEESELLAIGMLDGVLSLLNQKQVLWTLHLGQNLFSLSKLDVTKDGYEEIISCAWDGTTNIIDSEKNIVKFQFRENVMAFGAGYFGVSGSSNTNAPCLVYVTFNNTVVIYWNIALSRLTTANLLSIMGSQKEQDTRDALEKLGAMATGDNIDEGKFRQLCSNCLYGSET